MTRVWSIRRDKERDAQLWAEHRARFPECRSCGKSNATEEEGR